MQLSLGRSITSRSRPRQPGDALLAASSVIVSPGQGQQVHQEDDSPSRNGGTPKAGSTSRRANKWSSSPPNFGIGDVGEPGPCSEPLNSNFKKISAERNASAPRQRSMQRSSALSTSSTMRRWMDGDPAQTAPASQSQSQVNFRSLARSTRGCSANSASPSSPRSTSFRWPKGDADFCMRPQTQPSSEPALEHPPLPRSPDELELREDAVLGIDLPDEPPTPGLALSQLLTQELMRREAGNAARPAGTAPSSNVPHSTAAGRGSLLLARRQKPSESPRQACQEQLTVKVSRASSSQAPFRQKRHIRSLLPDEKIYDLYYWEEALQEIGDGGKVVLCRKKDSTSERFDYVMKIRSKVTMIALETLEQFRKSQERMLNMPAHVGVTPLHEVLEDDNFFYVVMPKATGGNFLCCLASQFQDGVMPMSSIKRLMREILEAVSHMHKQGVLHRDIKPDNMVMESYDDPGSPTGKSSKVMLIDFDHADADWSPATPMSGQDDKKGVYGTARFNAPETWFNIFSQESDLYSVGVTLYLLMTGKLPYNDDIFFKDLPKEEDIVWKETIFRRMRDATIDWTCDPWPKQPSCRNFCQQLLAFDASNRFSSAEIAMEHPWFYEANDD